MRVNETVSSDVASSRDPSMLKTESATVCGTYLNVSSSGLAHICAGTRPHLCRDSPTSAPGLAHICATQGPCAGPRKESTHAQAEYSSV